MGPVLYLIKVSTLKKQVDVLQTLIHSGSPGEASTITQKNKDGEPGSLNTHYIKKIDCCPSGVISGVLRRSSVCLQIFPIYEISSTQIPLLELSL